MTSKGLELLGTGVGVHKKANLTQALELFSADTAWVLAAAWYIVGRTLQCYRVTAAAILRWARVAPSQLICRTTTRASRGQDIWGKSLWRRECWAQGREACPCIVHDLGSMEICYQSSGHYSWPVF